MTKSGIGLIIEGIIILVLSISLYWLYSHPNIEEKEVIRQTTITKHKTDTVYLSNISILDRRVTDTIYITAPDTLYRESITHKDEFAEIHISGISPAIDSISYFIPRDTVFQTTEIERTVTPKKSFWTNRFYLGVGVSGGYSVIARQPDFMVGLQAGIRIL